jgi:hypothetical protein
MDKKFSVGTLAMTAAVTALVSGLIGTSLSTFFDRAKPTVSLLSIGFQAPTQGDSVQLQDDISTLSKQAHWAVSLERFESFGRLVEVEQKNRSWTLEATELVKNLEDWKSKYIAKSGSVYPLSEALAANAVRAHPFFSSDMGGAVMTVQLRRGLMGRTTYVLKDVQGSARVLDAQDLKEQSRWSFHLGYGQQFIPYKDQSESVRSAIELFAESISRGITQNVLEFTDYSIALTRKDILDAQKLSAGIQDALMPNTTVAATVAINNSGKSPITFSPQFGLRLEHPDYSDKNLVLVATDASAQKKENPFALTADGFTLNLGDRQKKGERARVEPFLPNASNIGYVTVPGGESVKVKLVGIAALGKTAKPLLELHATKLLQARVLAKGSENVMIWSELTPFSLNVDDAIKKSIETARP